MLFDPQQVRHNRQRASTLPQDHRFLHDWTLRNLIDRLGIIKRSFPQVLLLGGRADPALDSDLRKAAKAEHLVVMDKAAFPGRTATLIADEETLPFEQQSFDLITSPLTLHTVNDLPGTLIQIRRSLKSDGVFLGAMLGGQTLHELRECLMEAELAIKGGVSPRIFPFADKQQAGALMQRAAFALPVVDSEIVTVTYENIFRLMADLRGMGETNAVMARSRTPLRRDILAEAALLYAERYSDPDGRIRATFEIIFMIGWGPHESQQKPMRPGSATKSLADALGTQEIKTGDRAQP